jgi:hypothetical protein
VAELLGERGHERRRPRVADEVRHLVHGMRFEQCALRVGARLGGCLARFASPFGSLAGDRLCRERRVTGMPRAVKDAFGALSVPKASFAALPVAWKRVAGGVKGAFTTSGVW